MKPHKLPERVVSGKVYSFGKKSLHNCRSAHRWKSRSKLLLGNFANSLTPMLSWIVPASILRHICRTKEHGPFP